MKRHLALTGFMAAGKSTIGKKLARKLGVKFYDIDDIVVAEHGPISDIFYAQGEEQFRRYEYDAVARVVDDEPGIIALGGGAVTYDETLKLLKKRTYRVFVKVPPEQILGRLRRSKSVRPMLGPTPTLSRIKELYAARMPRYSHSDYVVEAEEMSTAQVVEHIIQWLHRKNLKL
jgi:shikimate kinase